MPRAREKRVEIAINEKWCKKCGICVEFCPKQIFITGALGEPQVNDPTKCTECRLCEILCPEFCITVNAMNAI